MKRKIYISPDIVDDGNDRLRNAIGCVQYKEEYEYDVEPPKKVLPENVTYNNPYHKYTEYGSEAKKLSYDPATEPDLRDIYTMKAHINSDDGDDNSIYKYLDKLEVNPSRIQYVNETAVVPAIKIPIRIYSDKEKTRGDTHWNNIFMGGAFGEEVYPTLVDIDSVFYDHTFEVDSFQDQLDVYAITTSPRAGAPDDTVEGDLGISIRPQYVKYDHMIQKFQQWEVDKHELELPNFLFETTYRKDLEKIGEISSVFDETNPATRDVLIEKRNEQQPYIDMVKYVFPKTLKAYPNSVTLPEELYPFKYFVADKEFTWEPLTGDADDFQYNNSYYGYAWTNEKRPPEQINRIKRIQKNLIFDASYFGTAGIFDNMQTDAYKEPNTANTKNITISLRRHIDEGNAFGVPAFDPTDFNDNVIETAQQRTLSVQINSDYKKIWHFRSILQHYDMSAKFLETLKDIEENQTSFKYNLIKLKSMTENTVPLTYESETDTMQTFTLEDVSLSSFNYLDFLVYMLNNQSEAINDNFLFVGNNPDNTALNEVYTDSSVYRFKSSSKILNTIDASVDSLFTYMSYLTPDYIDSQIDPESGTGVSSIQQSIYDNVLNPRKSYTECLAYKIEKFGGATEGDSFTQQSLQNFWIFNSQVSPDLPREIKIRDTQIKYGQDYTYVCYGYFAVISHKYNYSDFRLTKQTNNYTEDFGSVTTMRDVPALFCVQFYEPLSKVVAEQIFTISNTGERDPSGTQYSNLAEYNTFATSDFDVSEHPNLAEFYLNIEPCVKIIKVPLFKKTVTMLDNPGNKITVNPFYVLSDENKVGFTVMQDSFKPSTYPACLSVSESKTRKKYLKSKDMFITDKIPHISKSPARFLEIYRISSKPSSYYDFGDHLVSRIDLKIKNERFNRDKYTAFDRLVPNRKFYYLFRYVTENGMPGHASTIYEVELIDDGGYKYAVFDTVDTSQFVTTKTDEPNINFKKLLQIEPNTNQLEFNYDRVNFDAKANESLDTITVGNSDSKIWDKKFKIRLTSKKSGKKIDLNVKFNLQQKDFS